MNAPIPSLDALDGVAGRITAALIAERNIGAPDLAVRVFWQVRAALLRGEPAAAPSIFDDPAVCEALGVK